MYIVKIFKDDKPKDDEKDRPARGASSTYRDRPLFVDLPSLLQPFVDISKAHGGIACDVKRCDPPPLGRLHHTSLSQSYTFGDSVLVFNRVDASDAPRQTWVYYDSKAEVPEKLLQAFRSLYGGKDPLETRIA